MERLVQTGRTAEARSNIREEIRGPSTRRQGKEGWGDAPLGSVCPVCMEPRAQATAPYKVGVAGHGSVHLYTGHSTNLTV